MASPPSSLSARVVRDLISASLDLIFPPHCAGCGRGGSIWCPECEADVAYLAGQGCHLCGSPHMARHRLCLACRSNPPPLLIRSAARYARPLSSAVLAIKYRPARDLAEGMAGWLAAVYERENWRADVVIPVPLSRERHKRRGFNQAELISHPLAAVLKLDHGPELLRRIRRTPSQVGLSPAERAENVRDAFRACAPIEGKRVLLIDDLYTTGATLRACARAVLDRGASQVYGLTVARAC